MRNLFNNSCDKASAVSEAVLAYLGAGDGIEESWSDVHKKYMAEPRIARWYNCREQGYVVYLTTMNYSKQLNIAFFEHRNSDRIHCVMWEQKTMNPPTIDDLVNQDGIYKDKYDTSFNVEYHEAEKMATWIKKQLVEFWVKNNA